MNNIVQINKNSIQRKIYNNQPVVTFKDIDLVHERPEGTASRNFRNNKKHFIENVDYYDVTIEKCQCDEIRRAGFNNPRGGYLFTESGYLMLVKSFTDDLAWEVQRQLVNVYFKVKEENCRQIDLEPYKLEKKTYKGKPVMTVRDLVYLTGKDRDSINWKIKSKSLGILLSARTLEDFKKENNLSINAPTKLNILFNDDVYELIKNYNVPRENKCKIFDYFDDPSIPIEEKSIKVKDLEIVQKVEKLQDLYFLIQRFCIDDRMKGDICEIISERYVELGFLDDKCRDLSINSLEGWNLSCKYGDFKMTIKNN